MEKPILFVGLDVDTQAFHGFALSQDGATQFRFQCKPSGAAVANKLLKFQADGFDIRICYEAGYLGFVLQRDLSKRGFLCEVIAPSLTPVQPADQIKNDRLDSEKLASYFKAGLLTKVHVPGLDQEADRDLVRTRGFLGTQIRSAKRHVTSICHRVGLDYRAEKSNPRAEYWSNLHWKWIESAVNREDLPSSVRLNLNYLLNHIRQIQAQIDLYDSQIEVLADTPVYKPKVQALCCYRGIKTHTAMVLILEIGDVRRFKHPRQLVSYVGLDIREYSSAGKEHRFSITKMGNRYIRTPIIESCQTAYRPPRVDGKLKARRKLVDQQYSTIADKCMSRLHKKATRLLYRGKQANKVKVACARELLGFVWESLKEAQAVTAA